jgi:stress-induced-phosphoprotein 1
MHQIHFCDSGPGFLGVALDNMFQGNFPLRETTEVMKRIRLAAPKMLKIWQHSALSQIRDGKIAEAAQFEQYVLAKLEQGTLKMDDRVSPKMSVRECGLL